MCPFDPISSPFLICRILASIFIHFRWLWVGLFWLHFGPSALLCVSIVLQKRYWCSYVLWSLH
jgi:hypothetical protein